jgi:hypothetical protein
MDGATLSLVLERVADDIHEPEFVAYAPLVSFEAFLLEQRVFGWVRLDADRLTDLLNAHETVRLMNVLVEDLGSGHTVTADEAIVHRAEIVALVASGPRGDAARRQPTRAHPVVAVSGRYHIGGCVHAAPGMDPTQRLQEGGPMIPLTEAWLEYGSGAERRRQRFDTIIVNRELATRFEVVAEPTHAAEGRPTAP